MAGSEQDGLDGADADLFVGATWVLTPDAAHRPAAFAAVRGVRRASSAPRSIAVTPEHPRRARRGREPRAAARGVDADGRRRRAAASEHADAAAPRRRRLPRHDPHRGGPSRRSGPTSASPTATRSSARSTRTSTRCTRCGRSWPTATATRCSTLLETARGRAPQPARRPAGRRGAGRAAHPGARPPGRHRRGHDAGRPARRQHRRLRDRALARGRRAVCSCSSSPADGADAFEAGAARARLPRRADDAAVSMTRCPTSSRSAGPRPLRGRLRVPGDKSISHRALLFAAMADGRAARSPPRDGRRRRRARAPRSTQLGVDDRATRRRRSIVDGARRRRAARARRRARLRQLAARRCACSPACSRAGRSSRCSPATRRCAQRPMARVVEPLRAMGAHVDGRDGGTLRAARRSAAATLARRAPRARRSRARR